MKNEKIINAWNKLSPDDVIKDRILYRIDKKQDKPRSILRPVISVAAAAVIFIAVLGLFSLPQEDNIFSVKAYALYEEEDGSIGMREVDLVNQTDGWGGHHDGQYFYVSIGLKYEGENIKNVEFSVDEGFFAKQYIDDSLEDVPKTYIGDNQLVVFGNDFEIVGDKITLDDETMTDNLLLFWGMETPETETYDNLPDNINIIAKVTFNDSATQEQAVSIPLKGEDIIAMYTYTISEEEMAKAEDESEYYNNIPLEQLELVEESVQTITDGLGYKINGGTFYYYLDHLAMMEFDENGISRCGIHYDHENGDIFIEVIEHNNGEYNVMLYRVPEELVFSAD